MTEALDVVDAGVELGPSPDRVIATLFLPGESTPGGSSRTEGVLERVMATPPDEIATHAQAILERFADRHADFAATLAANAAVVRAPDAPALPEDLALLVGAVFTAEQSVEGAALCNPSAVAHPDQRDLPAGARRVLLSLRSIGESHRSTVQFAEAVVGPGRTWAFAPRAAPLRQPAVTAGEWTRSHLLRALEHDGHTDELVRSLGQSLPERFDGAAVEEAVRELRAPFMHASSARAQVDAIRIVAGSAYRAEFPEGSPLTARVLVPVADEERQGLEDARFVRFVDDDGAVDYRGTVTAFDGRTIASRLITTPDFRVITVSRLTGPPARTKGMALFPRRVGGRMIALARGDGESISITRSDDGLHWEAEVRLHRPDRLWDAVQSGNCGSPIETPDGWLVLTHGVGPMRVYRIGAILLDLDDPSVVVGVLPGPLLEPAHDGAAGYVPNVVYSCGGIVHDGILWIPHGVADDRVRVASVPLEPLIAAMRPPGGRRTHTAAP